ncbi:hypothetical protein GEMRC1_005850 [Eukaryota sp. GEM-RC1]
MSLTTHSYTAPQSRHRLKELINELSDLHSSILFTKFGHLEPTAGRYLYQNDILFDSRFNDDSVDFNGLHASITRFIELMESLVAQNFNNFNSDQLIELFNLVHGLQNLSSESVSVYKNEIDERLKSFILFNRILIFVFFILVLLNCFYVLKHSLLQLDKDEQMNVDLIHMFPSDVIDDSRIIRTFLKKISEDSNFPHTSSTDLIILEK